MLPYSLFLCPQPYIMQFINVLLQANTSAATTATGTATDYFPIGIQFLFAIGLITVMLAGSSFFRPQKENSR